MVLVFLIAISLSMDAFSLAIAYGMNNFKKEKIIKLSIMVGLFHFLMPFIGNLIGNYIFVFVKFDCKIVAAIIFVILSIEMFIDSFKEEKKMVINNIFDIFLFSLAVSIDSLGIGLSIRTITSHYYLSFLIFFITSGLFTLIGLLFGKYLSEKIGKYSTIIGSIILFGFGIYYFL